MRSLVWCLAHEKKLSDGLYGADPTKPKTVEVVSKLGKGGEKRIFVLTQGKDVFVEALRKPDQNGRVRGISGINIGHNETFAIKNRKEQKLRCTEGLIIHI